MKIKTPPMGFNTWNTFGESFNEEVIKEVADAMADRGFLEAGYDHLIIDDCWELEDRDPATGRMVPRPKKFPNSDITPTIDYVHSKGLKFGIYSCAGVRTCAGLMSSFDNEFLDAKTFAEWGVDYLKYDYCFKPHMADGETLYRRMSLGLRHSGRDIMLASCNWGLDDVWSWADSAGIHTYRSTGDICDNFTSFTNIFRSQVMRLGSNVPGCFNDMDMMTVGMEGEGNVAAGEYGNEATYRMQFCVWCMFQTPLIMGCDVRRVSDKYRDLLCNRELIAINQDISCRPPFPIGTDDRLNYCKMLSDGSYAILMINPGDGEHHACFALHDIGVPASSGYRLRMRDVFSGEVLEYNDFIDLEIPNQDCRMFRCELIK